MPLHEWTDRDGWEGMRLLWMTEIASLLRYTLPTPYRVRIGASPRMVGRVAEEFPVVIDQRPTSAAGGMVREPDAEVTVATLGEEMTVQVEQSGRLVAVVELISPRNKDRPDSRDYYSTRYLSCLHHGVHLLLIDVHRRPLAFSFPQRFATELETELPAPLAPCAAAYRVGEPMPEGGRLLAVWSDPLTVGQPLPTVSLPLTVHLAVPIDLEATYSRAADKCYLE